MKKTIIFTAFIAILFSSCNPYIVSGPGCGAWYKKKFSGKAPRMHTGRRMPVIN